MLATIYGINGVCWATPALLVASVRDLEWILPVFEIGLVNMANRDSKG